MPDCQALSGSSSFTSTFSTSFNSSRNGSGFSSSRSSSRSQKNQAKVKSLGQNERFGRTNIKVNDATHESLELESLNLELNGEDDYYDALNSENEDGIYATRSPISNIEEKTQRYPVQENDHVERTVNF